MKPLEALIARGEGEGLEFIPALTRRTYLKQVLVAFSNRPEGGIILVGVADDGRVVGLRRDLRRYRTPQAMMDAVSALARDAISPPSVDLEFALHSHGPHLVLQITVHPGPQPPYRSGEVYVRDGPHVRPATPEEVATLTVRACRMRRRARWRRWIDLGQGTLLVCALAVLTAILVTSWTFFRYHPDALYRAPPDAWLSAPAVSPDGRQVAFVQAQDDGSRLCLVDTSGALSCPLSSTLSLSTPAFSPDGRFLAYAVREEDRTSIRVLDLGTGRSHLVADLPASDVGGLAFSPDGATLAFHSDHENPGQGRWIYQIPLTGGTPQRLVALPGDNTLPAYSPDGVCLAFTHREEPRAREQIWTVCPGKQEAAPLVLGPGHYRKPAFTPQGDLVCAASRYIWWGIYRIDPETGKVGVILRKGQRDPAVSADGRWLVFLSPDDEPPAIYRMRLPGLWTLRHWPYRWVQLAFEAATSQR